MSQQDEIKSHLKQVLTEVLEWNKEIDLNLSFYHAGGDSLSAQVLISLIQQHYSVLISHGQLDSFEDMGTLVNYVASSAGDLASEKLPRAPVLESYAASSGQKRMYWISERTESNTSYNLPLGFKINGRLNPEKLEQAFLQLIRNHQAFRTSFELVGGEVRQRIKHDVSFGMERINAYEDKSYNNEFISSIIQNFIRPFDLTKAPLIRACLVKMNQENNILLVDMHHIISDGVSITNILKELSSFYNEERVPKQSLDYCDFSEWHNQLMECDTLLKQERYWLEHLEGHSSMIELPFDQSRPALQNFEGSRLWCQLDEKTTTKLRELANLTGCTLYVIMMTAYQIWLSKYSGKDDLVVGTTIAGRGIPETWSMIGMFANTVVLRGNPSAEKSFLNFLNDVKTLTYNAFENQDYPFERLVEKTHIQRDMSSNPIFNAHLTLQNVGEWKLNFDGCEAKKLEINNPASKFDISLEVVDEGATIEFCLEYATSLFETPTAERMLNQWLYLLEQVAAEPNKQIANITLVDEKEQELLFEEFNNTEVIFDNLSLIPDGFKDKVRKTPNHIAIISGDKTWTYHELNQMAISIAERLKKRGIQQGDIVGISLERSVEMLAGILGIWMVGAAYLPIDPHFPVDRIEYMVEDSGTRLMLTQSKFIIRFTELGIPCMELNFNSFVAAESEIEINSCTLKSEDLAYVIYTSGSTGKPKGVMIEHGALANRIEWMQREFPLTESDVILQKTTFTFDVSVWELVWWMVAGATVSMLKPGGEKDPIDIAQAVVDQKITVMHFVPSMFNAFLSYCEHSRNDPFTGLKYIFTSGEALPYSTVKRFEQLNGFRETSLINLYGPTEATIDVTYFDCSEYHQYESIPIGKPIANTEILILDQKGQLQPIGVEGELCIAGTGLARGYLNKDTLTAEKFVAHPFKHDRKIYRTGDAAKWLNDGNLEYIGRMDNQVKIRGYRIEPGEVESALLKLKILEAVVIPKQDNKMQLFLCAYIVPKSGATYSISELRNGLLKLLPEYMVPTQFVLMNSLPLTSNGKIDRRALPEPDEVIATGREYIAPHTKLQSQLAEIWADVLGRERIGIQDHFFELGGDSIKAIQICARLYQAELKLEMKQLFKNPILEDVTAYIQPLTFVATEEETTGLVDLTPIQHWFFELYLQDSNHWNQSIMLHRKEGFHTEGVKFILEQLVDHHDALRLSFRSHNNLITQEYQEDFTYENLLLEVNLKDSTLVNERIDTEIRHIQEGVHLSSPPLIRAGLFRTNEGDHLLLTAHHLVVDSVSWRILLEDFIYGYDKWLKGEKVIWPQKSNSFKEWSTMLHRYANSNELQQERSYWETIEKVSMIPLSKDGVSISNTARDKKEVVVETSIDVTRELLTNAHKAYNTEINDLLLAALGKAINLWSPGQQHMKLMLEGHGREEFNERTNVTRTVGWFTSMFPVNVPLNHEKWSEWIKTTKETLRCIPNRGIGYGILKYLSKSGLNTNIPDGTPPEILFNYLGQFDWKQNSLGIEINTGGTKHLIGQQNKRAFSLEIVAWVEMERLKIRLEYNNGEYTEKSISSFATEYVNQINELVNHCLSKEVIEYTPSDFGAQNHLDDDELAYIQILAQGLQN
ncbi:non-ribosomal peptide synthetase [Paenibacillus sp. FSL H7-0942]|uniref:non-ribosomal peptide synthetase n=1 Tax=Paenibacillus TaxID=44249 RepID=UPI00096C7AF7|nr:non-ribosomal peptide synthetase [Paenibacillus amylolyticus]OME97826.1 hypothetical protein BK129_30830 [Paenibacillus amylolyticus]